MGRPDSPASWQGLAAIAGAAALWAVAAAVARSLFDDGVPPIELVQARSYITALGLAAIPGAWRPPRRPPPRFIAIAGLGLAIAAVNTTYYFAIERLDVAVALVLQYTAPALVVAVAARRDRRAPERDTVIAVAATLLGVVLVSELPEGVGRLDEIGIMFGLASSCLFATYTLLSEKAGAAYGPLGALARAFPVAALGWVVFQVPRGWPHALVAPDHITRVLFVGVVGTLMPFILFLWGVGRVRAERAAIAATLEPVLAAIVAWFWLDQLLSPMQLAGGAIVIVAVLWLQARSPRAVVVAEL